MFLGGVMKQIRIGNSNIHASEIALGCMGMGGEWTHNPLTNEVKKQALVTIEAALEQGINFLIMLISIRMESRKKLFLESGRLT